MINYHNIGTIYMKGYLHSRKPVPIPMSSNPLTQQNNQTPNPEINSKTYNAASNKIGFTEELTKQHDGLIDEDLLVCTLFVFLSSPLFLLIYAAHQLMAMIEVNGLVFCASRVRTPLWILRG